MHRVQNMKMRRAVHVRTIVVTIARKAKKDVDAVANGLTSAVKIVLKILAVAIQAIILANFMRFLIMRNNTE